MEEDFEIVEESFAKYGEVKSFQDLIVWQKSMDLAVQVYEVSKQLPDSEKFGLTNQMRRAAVSVPSNIAEGWGRKILGSYIQFLRISNGSLCETHTQLVLCFRLNFIKENELNELKKQIGEIEKMLKSLISKLEQKSN